jgi:hypothetical protein
MAKFRDAGIHQKFASIHASAHNIFNDKNHLTTPNFSNRTASFLWRNGDILQLENSIVHAIFRP